MVPQGRPHSRGEACRREKLLPAEALTALTGLRHGFQGRPAERIDMVVAIPPEEGMIW